MAYHVNKATGETGICTASIRSCPLGSIDEHFTSEAGARAHYEELMEKGALASKTKDGRSIRGAWADLELYRDQIHPQAEVFVHPQGKIAFTSGAWHDGLSVWSKGKKAKTSGTLEDLRAGRGAWKQIKKADEPLPTAEAYAQSYAANPTVALGDGTSVPLKSVKNSGIVSTGDPRVDANLAAGYPKESPYDPRNTTITQGAYFEPLYLHDTSSILPLNERGNPFKLSEIKFGERLRFWNSKGKDGNEQTDSVFQVWEDGKGHYKAVIGYGKQIPRLGIKARFAHDQTGARMGEDWTLIGGFEPIEGGSIVGKVPSYAMPIYTYK